MNDEEDREDGDPPLNIDSAAKFRQLLRKQALATFDPLHQQLLSLEELGEEYGIQTIMNFDDDLSDLDLDIF